jgi:hypothetical protein
VPEIEISHRVVPRVLAILPAVVVALSVRVLTLGSPPVALRLAAAGVVAVACWTAYRLLTAKVTVTEDGVRVRGVLYDADVSWAELDTVIVRPASWPVRLLMWGVLRPQSVALSGASKVLSPIAMLSAPDDEEVDRAVGAMRVRSGAWRVPVQRDSEEIPAAS